MSNVSGHLDFVRQYRKRRRLHDRMLSELLGVVSAGVPRQDEAAPMDRQTKVPHPPVQPGLHMSLQLFHLRKTCREKRCCRSVISHGSASKVAGRTAKFRGPRSSDGVLSAEWT